MNAPPTTAQLASAYADAANAVALAPAGTPKAVLIVERDAAATAYFRARYEQQRGSLSRIQR